MFSFCANKTQFLCSDDIAADNLSQGYSAGNYTLNDQKNAFLWINKVRVEAGHGQV